MLQSRPIAMAGLFIAAGEQAGTYFRLPARPLVGGRDPAAEIQLLDPRVSRRHFMVVPEGDGFAVRELRSKNGVRVNEARIAGSQTLREGDEILVGDTRLVFSLREDDSQADALRKYRKIGSELSERSTARDSDD